MKNIRNMECLNKNHFFYDSPSFDRKIANLYFRGNNYSFRNKNSMNFFKYDIYHIKLTNLCYY